MNRVPETSDASPFLIGRYQSKYQNCVPAIQVALVAIMATGITLALLSHFDYLHPAFVYVGSSASVASLIALGILMGCQKNNLDAAINDVQSFEDLKTILEGMEIGTWWDCAHCLGADDSLKISSKNFSGDISSTELHDKFEKMLKSPNVPFNEKEKEAVRKITQLLDEKYEAANSNEQGFIPNINKYLNHD